MTWVSKVDEWMNVSNRAVGSFLYVLLILFFPRGYPCFAGSWSTISDGHKLCPLKQALEDQGDAWPWARIFLETVRFVVVMYLRDLFVQWEELIIPLLQLLFTVPLIMLSLYDFSVCRSFDQLLFSFCLAQCSHVLIKSQNNVFNALLWSHLSCATCLFCKCNLSC